MSWFTFGHKKNKNSFISRAPQCDGAASGSIATAMLFPMQYNGPTYTFHSFPDELIFIPYRDNTINPSNLFSNSNKLNHKYGIAALLIHGNPKNNPQYFMILFHGNGVDLGMASAIWRPLIRSLPVHLLIVEYPGYGIMDGRCTCQEVTKVAQYTYSFVTRPKSQYGLGITTDKLMILGRSIGTGPAAHIAKQKCHTLILVSPFTSIHNLSSHLMGKWTKWVLPKDGKDQKEHELHNPFVFNNVAQIDKWQCQNVMLFHGKNDELIPYVHTLQIVDTIKNKHSELEPKKFLMDGVGHNDVNIQFIGLRIFMQYQKQLQSTFCEDGLRINIDALVPYLDNPPQFDRMKNKVQNLKNNKSDSKQCVMKQNSKSKFIPTKIYDMALEFKQDVKHPVKHMKATKWIRFENK